MSAVFLKIVNGVPKHVSLVSAGVYEEDIDVTSTITTGSPVTLPNSGTYENVELEVFLNGNRLSAGADYNYVGSPPRTQVSFTFDLLNGDKLKFRKVL